jgi:hypothetical protein
VVGRVTGEALRRESRDRKRKSRAKQKPTIKPAVAEPKPEPKPLSVTHPHVTESPEITVEQRRAEHAELDDGERTWSTANLRDFERACKKYLPQMNEADLKTARAFVALDQWRAKKAA